VALSNGSRLGPYEILSPLGAGGMGEVYRATDTKLKRQVAIKILPTDLATDVGRLARFQREAEVLASLNHPHIAAIYGFEESGGVSALVMELVEGPTLADRIAQGPIAIEEALPIARQIADALEAAHERGIVHRDLKPANIKVRDDGTVKVLDFGLAKAVDHTSESSDFSRTVEVANSPTIASPAMSQVGVILGTAAYMSPEQARGRPVDKRTDVWAFGAVFYEMLSGTRAFEGEDITELMAAVVKSSPNWTLLPANVPPPVITLIQRCLEKDRKTRIGDIAVARFLLSGDTTTTAPSTMAAAISPSSRSSWLPTLPWIAAALIAGAAIGWMLPSRSSGAPEVVNLQTDVRPANFVTPSTNAGVRPSRTAIALSPDGRRLIFAGTRDGAGQLYARNLDQSDSTPLDGTDGAIAPFVSPDGAWIGFAAKSKLQKVPAAGGPATAICDLAGPIWGASWADDGNIYFAVRDGIFKVKSGGGTPEAVTKSDLTKGDRLLLPNALPGSKALLITSPPNLLLFRLDGGQQRIIVEGGSDGRYVPSGHIVFMKAGTLMAVPFTLGSLQVTGPAAAIVEGVMHGVNAGNSGDETLAGQFAISSSGTLLYASGGINPSRTTTLVWVDRKGVSQEFAPARPFLFPRLSPDGRKVAVVVRAETSRDGDLWMYDAERGTPTRLTFDGAGSAVWSPDSKRLVFSAGGGLHLINADGSSKPQPISKAEFNQTPASWSPGADTIAFMQRPTLNTYGLWVLPMRGGTAGASAMFLESRFVITYPTFSPDGRWMTFVSTESGGAEVYVQGYPTGEKTRISTEGGFEPIWTGNGKEILFRSGQGGRRFFSAEVRSLSPLQVDRPRLLFEAKPTEFDSTTPVRSWDATADGQRFLLAKNPESTDRPVTSLHVVLNWIEELKRRVK
jgi:eukaryotic-like serine/threonine-protein kinase